MSLPLIMSADPAKSIGLALLLGRKRLKSGSFSMPTAKKHDHPGDRLMAFRTQLWVELQRVMNMALVRGKRAPDVFVIEWAEGMRSGAAMAMHGYIRNLVLEWASEPSRRIPIVRVGPTQVKEHATGRGNATKEEMMDAARKRWRFKPKTHDEADALWIADYHRANG